MPWTIDRRGDRFSVQTTPRFNPPQGQGAVGVRITTVNFHPESRPDLPDSADMAVRERAARLRTIKRIQTPEDLIGVMVFLCAADSDFMTGQLVNVDGGSVMH